MGILFYFLWSLYPVFRITYLKFWDVLLKLSQFPIRLWCHCPGPVGYWQDGHICYLHPAAAGDWSEGDPGSGVGSHQRTGPAGNNVVSCLNVNSVSKVIWWHTIFRDWLLQWRAFILNWLLIYHINYSVLRFICAALSLLPLSPQIQKVILALGDYMGAACHACIGGTNLRNEIQKLQAEAPHIVVGTPGRVFDMLSRGHLCEYKEYNCQS